MKELENNLRDLKLKKAMLFSNIESMSEVNDSLYLQLGKVQAKIMVTQKEILKSVKNVLEE